MTLDVAFQLLGWGKDDWPSTQEVYCSPHDICDTFYPPCPVQDTLKYLWGKTNELSDVSLSVRLEAHS